MKSRSTRAAVAPVTSWKLAKWLPPILLTVSGVLVYSNTFDAPFIFDDIVRIEKNPLIRRLLPLSAPMANTNRPIGMLTFAINYSLHGNEVWGYHTTNLMIHILSGLTLFGIARRTLSLPQFAEKLPYSATQLAFSIALLWLVHPINTQAVTYIVQRLESLMSLCYLLTIYFFIRASSSLNYRLWLTLTVIACGFGMGVKEVMATCPIVVVWYHRAFLASSWKEVFYGFRLFYCCLFATWIVLIWCLLRFDEEFSRGNLAFVEGMTPFSYLLSQAGVLLHYLKLCVWPTGQCLDYGWPIARAPTDIVPQVALIGSLFAATIWAIFRFPAWGFLGGCFFIILGPTSSVVPILDLAFEHRMYLPSAAVISAVVLAIAFLLRYGAKLFDSRGNASLPAATTLTTIALLLATAAWLRNEVYNSAVGIWEATALAAPLNPRANINLAITLEGAGKYKEALKICQRAVNLLPNNAEALSHLGKLHYLVGNACAALEYQKKAIDLKPQNAQLHSMYAVTLSKLGRHNEAIKHFQNVIRMTPFDPDAHFNLAKALEEKGDIERSLHEYQEALRIQRDEVKIIYSSAAAFANAGRVDEAIPLYLEVLKLAPDHFQAHHNLGVILVGRGRLDEAIVHFTKALSIKPDIAISYIGLGDALAAKGNLEDAVANYRMALRIQPDIQYATEKVKQLESNLQLPR